MGVNFDVCTRLLLCTVKNDTVLKSTEQCHEYTQREFCLSVTVIYSKAQVLRFPELAE